MTSDSASNDHKIVLTLAATAKLLSISTSTLRDFVRHGEIAYIPLGRGTLRVKIGFHVDDIADFVKRRKVCKSGRSVSVKHEANSSVVTGFLTERQMRLDEKARRRAEGRGKNEPFHPRLTTTQS